MASEKINEREFQKAANWQKAQSKKISAARKQPDQIGSLVSSIVKQVQPKQKKISDLEIIWKQILPEQMVQNSQILDCKSGILKIKVNSPSLMYQFQMLALKLLNEINQQAGRRKIKQIKFQL